MLPQIRTYQPGSAIRRRAGLAPDLIRFFEEPFGRELAGWTAWTPTADLYETEDEFFLEMGLPGFRAEEVDVTVERGVLTVAGVRTAEEEPVERNYHVREHTYERFTRSFALPSSVVADDVTAEYENGMLTVRLPKVAEAKPMRVQVSAK